jgi:acetyl esterase
MFRALLLMASMLLIATQAAAHRAYPPNFENVETHTYKHAGDVGLRLWVFSPPAGDGEARDAEPRPAIVFFFGGGWSSGSPQQFEQHCRYLASRGMVAIAADYRVAKRHGVKAVECVRDAKSAVRWVRAHAEQLGIDPQRIVAAGGSAGGHIAACTGVLEDFDEAGEDHSISSKPAALVLFNPVLSFVPRDPTKQDRRIASFAKRTGVEPKALSPAWQVARGVPPTVILVGSEDYVLDGCKEFEAAMQQAGNRCELKLYAGRKHGFFNANRGQDDFLATLAEVDRFLESLGYVAGPPSVDQYFQRVHLR